MVMSRNEEMTAVRLAKQETGLITKPTLVWKLDADKGGPHDAQVTYQTDGLTWRADYNIVVNKDDTAADVGAWVSILNESGASYPNAKLKLVAGDVQRIQPPQDDLRPVTADAADGEDRRGDARLPGEVVLRIPPLHARPTDVGLQQLHQADRAVRAANERAGDQDVRLLRPARAVAATGSRPSPTRTATSARRATRRSTSTSRSRTPRRTAWASRCPPGGCASTSRTKPTAANEFIGEDVIQHTPKDEEVLVKLGTAFDIVGERKQTDFTANYDGHVITESFEIKVRNHKKEPVKSDREGEPVPLDELGDHRRAATSSKRWTTARSTSRSKCRRMGRRT